MPEQPPEFAIYRDYVRMYASMLTDLANSDSYILDLIANRSNSDFDRAIRRHIEQALK